MSAGNESAVKAELVYCDKLYDCQDNHCDEDCRQHYGTAALGFRYNIPTLNDTTCVCRYRC